MENKSNIFKIIIICACAILLIGLFLPYETAIGEHKKNLKQNPDAMYAKEVNITNKGAINISIFENFKVYSYIMNHDLGSSWDKDEATINFVLIIVLCASIIFTALFTLLNKHGLTKLFTILLLLSSILMNYDIVSRKVVPSSKYTYGITFFLYPIVAVIIFVIDIISKKKNKKEESA